MKKQSNPPAPLTCNRLGGLIVLTIPSTGARRFVTGVTRDGEGRINDVFFSIYAPSEQVNADIDELNEKHPEWDFRRT